MRLGMTKVGAVPDLATLIINSGDIIDPLLGMLAAICWLVGFMLGIKALLQAAKASQSGGSMREGWGGPIGNFVIGVLFLMLGQLMDDFTVSSFGANNAAQAALGYNPPAFTPLSQQGVAMIRQILRWCEFCGYMAFVKGLFMVRATANGLHPQTYGPGSMFMVGGVCAANIVLLINMICWTLGVTAFIG